MDNLLESDMVDSDRQVTSDLYQSTLTLTLPDAHTLPSVPFMTSAAPENSLGLQLEQLQIADAELSQSEQPEPLVTERPSDPKEKKKEKPYINPERFKTGGPQRV